MYCVAALEGKEAFIGVLHGAFVLVGDCGEPGGVAEGVGSGQAHLGTIIIEYEWIMIE